MSERDEEELSPEAKAFLSRHASTGEPSDEALARGKQRLASPVVPRRSINRSRFPPEVMAAAAVVVLLLAAQLLYLAVRTPKVAAEPPSEPKEEVKATGDADVKAVAEAWRAGDFSKAKRLASKDCRSAGCGELNSELAEMLGLARHVDTLSDDEFNRLSAFDKKLSEGRDSALRRQLENRPRRLVPVLTSPAAQSEAEALYDEARQEKTAKNYERAISRLEKCVQIAPGHHPCYRLLGSVYAAIATRDQSASDMERARKYYERFLEVAPLDDEYVPKVRAILDAAKDDSPRSVSPRTEALPSDSPPEPEPRSTMSLTIGLEGDIKYEQEIARIALGGGNLAEVSVTDSHSLHVKGINPGTTTVLVWLTDGTQRSVRIDVNGSEAAKRSAIYADAITAKREGDWVRAIELARKVVQADPGHLGAVAIINEGRSRARETYLRGYQLRESSPDEAVALFKEVMAMTPPDDDLHQKAKSRVNEFEKR